jgi:phospholipase/carboxylesterase
MAQREADDILAILPPLLQSLDALEFIARHLSPQTFSQALAAVGRPQDRLAAELQRLESWPEGLAGVRDALLGSSREAMSAFDEIDAALAASSDLTPAFRALRRLAAAQEALYPIADGLAPVSRYFLEPGHRDDVELLGRLAGPRRDDTGLAHMNNEPGARGGFSLYVPETYTPERPAPLVVALHGGSGNGRAFLWTWLRAARTRGAILVAPTAVGQTWALQDEDVDTPKLHSLLDFVRGRWSVDPARMLLTGMSDGGTFSYVSGLDAGSPFTHLAPVSAAFHPMLAQMADPERVRGLPIHIVHGALDWMFPVEMAREAQAALAGAGANVTYQEPPDLAHTYPRELNAGILAWLDETAAA